MFENTNGICQTFGYGSACQGITLHYGGSAANEGRKWSENNTRQTPRCIAPPLHSTLLHTLHFCRFRDNLTPQTIYGVKLFSVSNCRQCQIVCFYTWCQIVLMSNCTVSNCPRIVKKRAFYGQTDIKGWHPPSPSLWSTICEKKIQGVYQTSDYDYI